MPPPRSGDLGPGLGSAREMGAIGTGATHGFGIVALRAAVRRLATHIGLVGAVGTVCIAALGAMGVVFIRRPEGLGTFNLDGEGDVPAAFSGGLLLAGAIVAALLAQRGQRRFLAIALVLGAMALEEVFFIHERLEVSTGVDWQVLYAPVGLLGLIVGIVAIVESHREARWLLGAGGVAFLTSQLLEAIQWDGTQKVSWYEGLLVPEELLEMASGLLFLCALLSLAGRRLGAHAST